MPGSAIAALGARKTRRPVRVQLTRTLDRIKLTGKRHPFMARYSAGISREGRIEGVRIALYSDGGWGLRIYLNRFFPGRCFTPTSAYTTFRPWN